MEFSYILRALFRRKWIIISGTAAAMIAAFLFTRNTPKMYRSSAQLSTGFTVTEAIKLSEDKFNVPEIDIKFNNAIENITSPKVLSLLSYRLMLHDLEDAEPFTKLNEKQKEQASKIKTDKKTFIRILNNKLDSLLILSPLVPAEKELQSYIDNVYDYGTFALNKGLKVGRYQRTDYINIAYISRNPYLSAFAVNTLCREFRRFYGLERRERTDVSIVTLDSLLQLKRDQFDKKIQEKNTFLSSNGVLDVSLEGSSKLGQVGNFENQLIEAKATQQNLIYQIEQIKGLIKIAQDKGSVGVTNTTNNNTTSNNSEYARLRKEYNELNTQFVEGGAVDPELKGRLNVIASQLEKLDMNNVAKPGAQADQATSLDDLLQKKIALEGLLMATNQKISSLQTAIAQLNGGINSMAAKSAVIEQLDKEIEMASSEYKEASDRYNLALNLNGAVPGVFKQTMIGEPPLRPLPNRRAMTIALAGMVAFVISSLVIIGIEFFDQSVKTPSQFQRLTALPVLGTINFVKLHNNNILDQVTLFDGKENRDNIFRELLRKLRYEIENSGKKIFLFTSTEPSQGKTTLIQSLAYSLSLSKKRVLIIDTNFCNNDITKTTNANPVLEKFNLNGKPFDIDSIKPFVTKTKAEGIDIIGCEGGDYTPSEILPKNHLLNYLELLKEEYDYIFMEGAPLNIYTDTKELVKFADGLIGIFAADSSLTAADKESISFLNDNKDKFLGAILNKVQEANLDL